MKQLHFDFESVRVCYFDIDLGMTLLSNKWKPFFYCIYSASEASQYLFMKIEIRGIHMYVCFKNP